MTYRQLFRAVLILFAAIAAIVLFLWIFGSPRIPPPANQVEKVLSDTVDIRIGCISPREQLRLNLRQVGWPDSEIKAIIRQVRPYPDSEIETDINKLPSWKEVQECEKRENEKFIWKP